MISSNVRKKNKGITECDKSTVIYDVDTIQFENVPSNMRKKNKGTTEYDKYSHVMLVLHNVKMVPSNVRKK